MKIKVYIAFNIMKGAYGGGNQFLAALKKQLNSINCYTEIPSEADIILFNSHHNISNVAALKFKYPSKVFIHRIAGPIKKQREFTDMRDDLVWLANKKLADASIFQTKWSFNENVKFNPNFLTKKYAIIKNSANDKIFFKEKSNKILNEKIRLIYISHSPHKTKGFEDIVWLDKYLDFTRFDFIFIGDTLEKFNNIVCINKMNQHELVHKLKESDIFIAPNKNEPCSNAIIEALQVGLPVIAKNSGGNPELILNEKMLYNTIEEVPSILEYTIKNYTNIRESLPIFSIKKTADEYINFFNSLKKENISDRKYSIFKYIQTIFLLKKWKFDIVKLNLLKRIIN